MCLGTSHIGALFSAVTNSKSAAWLGGCFLNLDHSHKIQVGSQWKTKLDCGKNKQKKVCLHKRLRIYGKAVIQRERGSRHHKFCSIAKICYWSRMLGISMVLRLPYCWLHLKLSLNPMSLEFRERGSCCQQTLNIFCLKNKTNKKQTPSV